MHRAERVLKSRVLGGGENPPRALQLVNAPEALQPRAVDQVLLRRSPRHAARPAFGAAHVARHGTARQVDARGLLWKYRHQAIVHLTTSARTRPPIAARGPVTA